MDKKPTVQFVPEYFLDPVHPITVHLVGAGGNGSQMLSALARINNALIQLGQKGLDVTVFDPDTVEMPNIGRQLFSYGDLGLNKAECLVSRFNRCFGTGWKAVSEKYKLDNHKPNIIITCVDNKKTRQEIGAEFRKLNITENQSKKNHLQYKEFYTFYWLDLGNSQMSGQAVLGSNRIPQPKSDNYECVEYLPTITEMYDLETIDEKDNGPSCSMAEALSKQDLFINSVLVQASASLLWSLLHDAAIDSRGLYVNLENYRMASIPITKNDASLLNKKYCK